ncbi:unnamed protein product [Dicrocoelium dendriticum]|nr:unnamed protein product [Dicrocoelium dendriticum]
MESRANMGPTENNAANMTFSRCTSTQATSIVGLQAILTSDQRISNSTPLEMLSSIVINFLLNFIEVNALNLKETDIVYKRNYQEEFFYSKRLE